MKALLEVLFYYNWVFRSEGATDRKRLIIHQTENTLFIVITWLTFLRFESKNEARYKPQHK